MTKMGKLKQAMRVFLLRWETRYMEKTTKSRMKLRHEYTVFDGKIIKVLDYIDIIAKLVPRTVVNGHVVNHRQKLREIYYSYDLKGLNMYVKRLNKNVRKTVKKNGLIFENVTIKRNV
jgi:hypothetical protein